MKRCRQVAKARQPADIMGWHFWIDRGGTFTDIVALSPDGSITAEKLLSENPKHYPDAALAGMRRILGVTDNQTFPTRDVESIKMGTTVATNALLERKGERTLLAITRGFADALFIGNQNRPQLFDLKINRPGVLYSETIEVEERVFADGTIGTPLNEDDVRSNLQRAHEKGFRSVAIILLHADRHPTHEQRVAEIATEIGFEQISASHDVIPLMKLIGRGDTTVADAYLSPILKRYVSQVEQRIDGSRLFFMQSNGGLTSAGLFRGKDAILSGPAGGVVGMAGIASSAGIQNVIGFDMGGTSTDVSHFKSDFERTFDSVVAGVRIRAPMMLIHTVAAGGGSMCIFDGLRLRVGPESAGAQPGPVAYRQGGPLTITDCNILLGRIQARHFPSVFGNNGTEPLDTTAVHNAFETLVARVNTTLNTKMSVTKLAEGFIALATDNMANAIKTISVQRGYDISTYSLVSFGGAGGQHACQVADALGIEQILVHPLCGVLSAYGMGMAHLNVVKEQTIAMRLNKQCEERIGQILTDLGKQARLKLNEQGLNDSEISIQEKALIRYDGSDTALAVAVDSLEAMVCAFEQEHRQLFGFIQENKDLVAEAVTVEAFGGGAPPFEQTHDSAPNGSSTAPLEQVDMVCKGEPLATPIYHRTNLEPGHCVQGPALIVEDNATTVVEPDWRALVTNKNHLKLTRQDVISTNRSLGAEIDPVKVEIFNNLFMTIAEQMGAVLRNTAYSVNIKERLDFSCAVFDINGALVANAPHMPVHLGSMGESVRAVLNTHLVDMNPGDVFVTNAPYNGGTHLPDVTVIAPVFDKITNERAFLVAARGHHADIGGISPGSMPPYSTTIDQEGVLIDAVPLVKAGQFLESAMYKNLGSGPYPARNPQQNIADLHAQVAACMTGSAELHKMIDQYGLNGVKAYTQHVQANAEEAVRRVIGNLKNGSFTAPMDDGSHISVAVTVDRKTRSVTVDFSGTSQQRPNNFNAPSAVCRAAVLYVFRTLVDDNIPMNEGCLKPIKLIIPEGSMINPKAPAAVVAGNVETSQIICDALFSALGRLAASQGTMNNLTFGNDSFQYYETICGGAGAGSDFDGADAVHTHMTNSRLTDPEVLEWRFPVVVDSFQVRPGSGGAGLFQGGNGVYRRLKFLDAMTVSILSGRRRTEPFGLNGGQNGRSGETWIERADGTRTNLDFADSTNVTAGDTIVIATPGGGGYGDPNANRQ